MFIENIITPIYIHGIYICILLNPFSKKRRFVFPKTARDRVFKRGFEEIQHAKIMVCVRYIKKMLKKHLK